jgi:hypothetical protein
LGSILLIVFLIALDPLLNLIFFQFHPLILS